MNFIFISPNFPHTYWNFCDRLKRNGVNVLGIGDCPYDDLDPQLKACLTEYYKVGNMESYDEMYRVYVDGEFLGVASIENGSLIPKKVFR